MVRALKKLIHVLTASRSLGFVRGQLRYMAQHGLDVHLVASVDPDVKAAVESAEGVRVHAVPITRTISPLADARALWRLYSLFRDLAPDIVHAGTPKGALLGIAAAAARRVPIRVYHMHGIRGQTARGWRRRVLMAAEKATCRLSTRVLCVSASARELALDERLCPPDKILVLGSGSCNGVDARGRFDPARFGAAERASLRASMNIPASAKVIGFVGRIVRDKGIGELALAWQLLATDSPDLHLVLLGSLEAEDPPPEAAVASLRSHRRVHFVPWVSDPAPYYAVMDVVVLPTYREGLPNVPLEAAAMRLPVVASRVTGCVDAIADGITGTLVPPGAPQPLAEAIARYLRDARLREQHGAAGRERVLREFVPEQLWERILTLY
jgi:glycosyltransferase involved in cell wall biosynthesis